MEILIDGKSKAYSKLPSWLFEAVRSLLTVQEKHVIIIARKNTSSKTSFDLYHHRSKQTLRAVSNRRTSTLALFQQNPPDGTHKLPEWVETFNLTCLSGEPFTKAIVDLVLTRLLKKTVYSEKCYRRTTVSTYASQTNPIHGGQITSCVELGDFYGVTIHGGSTFYVRKKNIGDTDKVNGHFIVMSDPENFTIVKPEVFFDYYELV